MSSITIYSVIQHPEWACPGMWVFVNEDGNVVGQQQNPANDATREWAEGHWGKFNPDVYKSVKLVGKL